MAQTASQTFGAIAGTVKDAKGAVVQRASVTVSNKSTSLTYTAASNETGGYIVANLPVGIYAVRAEAPGFGTAVIPEIAVSIGFTSTANLALKVGAVSESITVSANTTETQVNTSDGNLSTQLSNQEIMNLPLEDRDPAGLVLLSPGAAYTTSSLGGYTINGSRERNVNFLVDGSDNNDTFVPGIPNGLASPNIDATSEFRVVSGGYDAQYGRVAGSQILVATKSGTNDFHGAAYIYYRSDKWEAPPPSYLDIPINPLQHREYGGQIGGPILRKRAFFFVNYEQHHDIDGASYLRYVPSANARTGIINDPYQGTINLNNALNNSQGLSPSAVMSHINALYPLGNDHGADYIPGFIEAYRFGYGSPTNLKSVAARIDYQLSNVHSLSGSYNIQHSSYMAAPTFPGWNDNFEEPYQNQVLALNLVSSFSPRVINNAHYTANRTNIQFLGAGSQNSTSYLPKAVLSAMQAGGAPAASQFPGQNPNNMMVNFYSGDYQDITVYNTDWRSTGTYSAADTLSLAFGNHTLAVGGQFDWVYENSANNFNASEELALSYPNQNGVSLVNDSNGDPLGPYDYGTDGYYINDAASWYYGVVSNQFENQFFNKSGQRSPQDERGFRARSLGVFVQDTWKILPNLTLSYGLRWQYNTVPWEVNGELSGLVGQNPSGPTPAGGFVFQPLGKNSGGTHNLYEDDYLDLGPRFGFAWDPYGHGKTSVRGGYGIFYDRVYGNLYGNARANAPFQTTYSIYPEINSVDSLSRPSNTVPTATLNQDYTYQAANLFPLPGNNSFEDVMRMPLEQHYSFGIQQSLFSGILLDAEYVGSNGQHELNQQDASQTSVTRVDALTGSHNAISTNYFNNWENGVLSHVLYFPIINVSRGRSNYNSLQVKVTKEISQPTFGKAFLQGSYTWSHSIDDATDPLVAAAGESTFPADSSGYVGGLRAQRGNSGFDVRDIGVFTFVYELPFRFQSGWLDRTLGHFQVSGILSEHTGNAYTIWDTVDSAGTGSSQRASWAANGNALAVATPIGHYPVTGPKMQRFAHTTPVGDAFDESTGSFIGDSDIGSTGSVGRNYFYGPHWENFDMSVIKRIPITEKYLLRVEASAFNSLNHVVPGLPNATIDQPGFGQSTSQANSPRNLQIAARFEF